MQRLAALVPRPRLHLIRFHGVLAPNAKLRALVVPQEPEAPAQEAKPAECEANCAHHRPVRLSWAKLLKRVFEIDLEHRPNCGGELKIIAAILEQPGNREDPHASGSAGARTASGAGPRPGAASGLTLPNCDRSGDPVPRAAGVSCARGFPGPMESAWRQGVTRRRRPRKRLFACAVNAQQISAASKDRFKRVGCRVLPCWGCHGEGKGRLKILSSTLRSFARHLHEIGHCGPLTVEVMTDWARRDSHGSTDPITRARR